MNKLRPNQFDFKLKEQNLSYQSWTHKTATDVCYILHMVWCVVTKQWVLELEKEKNNVSVILFEKQRVANNEQLAEILSIAGYPPAMLLLKNIETSP